jgi:hypothetical protein
MLWCLIRYPDLPSPTLKSKFLEPLPPVQTERPNLLGMGAGRA